MNAIEAVECMKQRKRVTHGLHSHHWYQLYSDGSVVSLLQNTTCAATILGIWKTTDEFIKSWNQTGGSRGPTELQLYDGVG
jgi:hypothetical protein